MQTLTFREQGCFFSTLSQQFILRLQDDQFDTQLQGLIKKVHFSINSIYNILRVNSDYMGNQQPKPISRVTKAQIDIGALKARIHLELFRDRKNAEVVKVQKELVAKIKNKTRNRTQEVMIAERVIQGLKYASACNLLIGYASNVRMQAQFISDNMFNIQKMEPFLVMVYSLIFAADVLGLSSLTQFKALMRALNDPIALEKYVNPEIKVALTPTPTAEELNIYMLQFSQRNNISLQEINMGGHKFTQDWKNIPSVSPNNIPSNFTQLEKKLAEDFKNKFNGPNGFNQGGIGGGNNGGNMGGIGGGNMGGNNISIGGNGGFNPYQNFDPRQPVNNNGEKNNVNPYDNNPNFTFGPTIQADDIIKQNNQPNVPINLGPKIYVPPQIAPSKKNNEVRQSITSINDIDYYPQIDANPQMFNKGGFTDPDFEKICERLRKGL